MADNILQVQQELVNRLLDNIPTGYTADRIKTPNSPFNTPENEKWLRVTTNLSPKENVTAGEPYKRQFGIFTIDIFVPKGVGELDALNDFKTISALYENQSLGDAKCEAVSPNIINNNDNWFNVQADVVFYYQGY